MEPSLTGPLPGVEMNGPVLLFGLLFFLLFDTNPCFAIIPSDGLQRVTERVRSEGKRSGREDPERVGKARGIGHKVVYAARID
ncbi:MAG TPA: hypothetical protein VK673_20235 [Chthoniobacterales bacterium]|nr:hypothetical protein [Chthoniobacterales bacterium]